MKEADNPNTMARFKLAKLPDHQVVLHGVDDDGDPFRLTLNDLLVHELIEDLTLWRDWQQYLVDDDG